MAGEKQRAAASSVIAAVFLTVMKAAVGVITGSLGIISEALHSVMDLFAAGITFFAVRFADKPADVKHNYGHGKMESLSAAIEVLILWGTCVWIIYEAARKIFFGQSLEIEGSYFGIAVLIVAIIIDISRSRLLKKVARKHNSQALEADALHFSSDVWSSCVVIAGLVCVWAGETLGIGWLKYADPIAALGVAALVIKVSFKLGRETLNVLLDAAPKGTKEKILADTASVDGVAEVGDIRVRASGAALFIDLTIGVDRNCSMNEVNAVAGRVKSKLREKIPNCDIVVVTYPVDTEQGAGEDVYRTVKNIVGAHSECANIHNVHVYESESGRRLAAHVELKKNLTLKESHALSHRIEREIYGALESVSGVSITFEFADQKADAAIMSDEKIGEIINGIRKTVAGIDASLDCHDIELFKKGDKMSAFLHCASCGDLTVDRLKALADRLKSELKKNIGGLESVHIHFEPSEEQTQEEEP